ncbi:hypothetical protein FA13DRAFT_1739051 [Coprinellus micaceus]|uniref:Uncharacterized protein n=1 Tax=Coprinellus micaceus TaxID=71717 RepID=A0A4Y7SS70_COPMI|nr:hypothetical protein FA13DRAFT_1739051 [Coprinellus micaceus]
MASDGTLGALGYGRQNVSKTLEPPRASLRPSAPGEPRLPPRSNQTPYKHSDRFASNMVLSWTHNTSI